MAFKSLNIMGQVPADTTDADLDKLRDAGEAFLKSVGLSGTVSVFNTEDVAKPTPAPPANPAA